MEMTEEERLSEGWRLANQAIFELNLKLEASTKALIACTAALQEYEKMVGIKVNPPTLENALLVLNGR